MYFILILYQLIRKLISVLPASSYLGWVAGPPFTWTHSPVLLGESRGVPTPGKLSDIVLSVVPGLEIGVSWWCQDRPDLILRLLSRVRFLVYSMFSWG